MRACVARQGVNRASVWRGVVFSLCLAACPLLLRLFLLICVNRVCVHARVHFVVGRYEEIVNLLRKKLASKNFRVVFLTATLVETLVQNCGVRFHQALASERFMAELKDVVKVGTVPY